MAGRNLPDVELAELPELPPLPARLAGKEASESEIVRWVSRNIEVDYPDPEACPDPFAWTLLRQCRDTPGFTSFFIEKLWGKLVSTKNDQEGVVAVDGEVTMNLIDRLLKIKVSAETKAKDMSVAEDHDDAFSEFEPGDDE